MKNADITWESVSPQVVSVAGAGLLCAVSAGSGAVIARATNPGRGTIETRITVHVQAQVVTPPPVVPVYVPPPAPDAATIRIAPPTPVAAPEPQVARSAVNTPPPLEAIAWNPPQTPSAKSAPSGATMPLEKGVVDQLRAAVTPSTAKTLVTPTPASAPRPQAVPEQKRDLVGDVVTETTPTKRTAVAGIAAAVLVVAIGGWLAMRDRAPATGGRAGEDTSTAIGSGGVKPVADPVIPDTPTKLPDLIVAPVDSARNGASQSLESRRRQEKLTPKVDSSKLRRSVVVVDSAIVVPKRDTAISPDIPKPKPGPIVRVDTNQRRVVPHANDVVEVKPTVDTPTDADIRAEVDRVVSRVRTGAGRPPELAGFFSDGDDQKVSLASPPVTVSESAAQGRSRAQFIIRLTKRDSFGVSIARIATVTIDVTKRDGATSSNTVSVGTLRKP